MTTNPKFRPNQMVKILHGWAKDIPPRPVLDVAWDDDWGCYTYSFPAALIRIEEYMLAAIGEPDQSPKDWLAARNGGERGNRGQE